MTLNGHVGNLSAVGFLVNVGVASVAAVLRMLVLNLLQ